MSMYKHKKMYEIKTGNKDTLNVLKIYSNE